MLSEVDIKDEDCMVSYYQEYHEIIKNIYSILFL
jgi:hypothetical protein